MRIASGITDQVVYFVAVDATDLKTRETGLTTFTVYRDRNGGGAAVMTTPTITEVDATNMPGLYKLLLDEDMTIGTGNLAEEMAFHITQAAMAPVTRTIELFNPNNYTIGTVTTNTDMRGTDSAATEAKQDIIDANIDTLLTRIIGTLAAGTHNPATAAQIAVLSDWINGGRLDLILDLILGDSSELQTNQGNWLTATGFSTHSVADIFNEVLSKGTYNVGQSLAKIVRELGSWNAAEGVTSGTPTTTSITTNITGYDDNFFRDQRLWAYNGAALAGQSRVVTTYNGTTGVFTFDEPFTSAHGSGDDVLVSAPHVHGITEIKEAVRAEMDANSTKLIGIIEDTNELQAAHTGGNLGSDIDKINGVAITGDGSTTPFDV